MKNITVKVDKNQAVITVDLTKDFGPSSSGKSNIVATTEGNQQLEGAPDGVKFGLTVYKKVAKK